MYEIEKLPLDWKRPSVIRDNILPTTWGIWWWDSSLIVMVCYVITQTNSDQFLFTKPFLDPPCVRANTFQETSLFLCSCSLWSSLNLSEIEESVLAIWFPIIVFDWQVFMLKCMHFSPRVYGCSWLCCFLTEKRNLNGIFLRRKWINKHNTCKVDSFKSLQDLKVGLPAR